MVERRRTKGLQGTTRDALVNQVEEAIEIRDSSDEFASPVSWPEIARCFFISRSSAERITLIKGERSRIAIQTLSLIFSKKITSF